MSDARQALQAAEQVGARQFAAQAFEQAQAHLKSAEEALAVPAYREARREAELARLRAIEARTSAQVVYRAQSAAREAARLGALAPDTATLLTHAIDATQRGDEQKAHALADQVTQQANAAINKAYLKQAWALINEIQPVKERLSPAQVAAFRAGEQAFWQDDGRKALEVLSKLKTELAPGLR